MYGNKLLPTRSIRRPRGIRGLKQHISVTNNPSTIDQNQLLTVIFPNLSSDDVVVPGTSEFSFNIKLRAWMVMHYLGRAIVKKVVVKIECHELVSIDDFDNLMCWSDLWMTSGQRGGRIRMGICSENLRKLRVGAKDAFKKNDEENRLGKVFGSTFCIPLDFELLESTMPFHQSGLSERLTYELTFNDYGSVIVSMDKTASYTIDGITLEYDVNEVRRNYADTAVLYNRVLTHRTVAVDKADSVWNFGFNTPSRSLKGILILFEDGNGYGSKKFYNPMISKVSVTVEGHPNQLCSSGLKSHHQWEEVKKHCWWSLAVVWKYAEGNVGRNGYGRSLYQ